mmetsp:Transcript_53735/g.126562  ORF Transcript_53735/g.126562 Transcript_53735/m.126562 type:complete len:240 (-) Transcript_53735:1002-1721(-)
MHQRPDGGVVGLLPGLARHGEVAGQAQLVFEVVPHAAGVGFARDDAEAGGGEEVLRDRAPQVPHRLEGGVLFALDEGLGVQLQQPAQLAQKGGGAVQPDRRLQPGPLQRFAQQLAELAVQADVDVGVGQLLHIGQVAAQRERHVDLGTDAFDQPTDLVQVARAVELAIAGADQVDARLHACGSFSKGLARRDVAQAVLGPQPVHRAVGALPLVFIDGARQEARDRRALRRHATADHLGD